MFDVSTVWIFWLVDWIIELLNYWIIELLNYWIIELLNYWIVDFDFLTFRLFDLVFVPMIFESFSKLICDVQARFKPRLTFRLFEFSDWSIELLNYWIIELLNYWIIELLILTFWLFDFSTWCSYQWYLNRFRSWYVMFKLGSNHVWRFDCLNFLIGRLNYWIIELLNYWIFELLNFWIFDFFEFLDFWIFGLLNYSIFEFFDFLNFWLFDFSNCCWHQWFLNRFRCLYNHCLGILYHWCLGISA
jgi:hypothetical protein